ncbi:hypothetical protein TNCV_3610161 [Trichonephila clavipes]|nr:hypothetical protein TNCV_3610161 [Trichonephila clavipes]
MVDMATLVKQNAAHAQRQVLAIFTPRCSVETHLRFVTPKETYGMLVRVYKGNFEVVDAPRSGRTLEIDDDTIKALNDANQRLTNREITARLTSSQSSIHRHLKHLGLL